MSEVYTTYWGQDMVRNGKRVQRSGVSVWHVPDHPPPGSPVLSAALKTVAVEPTEHLDDDIGDAPVPQAFCDQHARHFLDSCSD